ncbi:hypothetical protein [Klebsiella pneumoniae]|uniref:hypothetical protein n=1 Tax=Klebsiella pneumoniae TaxID=573 RepID=UPI000DE7288E|nr:hypothetical protein [Klebsiella pneumoniae]HCA3693513.1 hypothetical protein [Klebsiella aerogenes]MEA4464963.1 hypothetical protein [Klebsiella pneumoniae]MEA4505686.1 hypothetical protein [Klebsiella pneumoniae]SSJ94744.1 Uncharacterised protein [Klebsiella pneumoniae]HBS7933986.1 hypothetical protein [Klebsiella pneumoniae]
MYRITQIISLLSNSKSASVKAWSKGERVAKKCQYWFLGLAVLSFAICVGLAIVNNKIPLSQSTKHMVLYLILSTPLFASLSFLPDIIIGFLILIKWRQHMLVSLTQEIDKDEKNARRLMEFSEVELQYAKYWIELKITRNDSRLKLFFGDKTAALALLGLSWPIIKELGGLDWISSTFSHFLVPGHVLDTIIWLCLALLLGLSLGGIMMKNVNEKYKYQVSLIELALKLKSLG